MKFESFYFYTNQRALKNYLVNYKIEPSLYRNELNRTLSDLGQNFLLFWKSEIGIETILKNCKTDGGDIPVVLKVLLPAETVVEAYFSDETIKSAKISECFTAYAVKFACPVSFFNVTDIFYVDKQIQFLQGDTTLIIPKQLIRNEPFTALSALDDNIVDSVINSFSKTKDNVFSDDDEDDETEFGADILSGFTDETADEKDVREKSQKEDKLIAAYLMFIQGKTLFDGRFSQRIYSVTGSPEIQFDKVVHDNFYKKVLQHIVSENIRYLQAKDIDYISCLKGSKSDDIYTPAITALLNNRYSYDDKDRFLNDYIAGIKDISARNEISEIFADKRARNRISLLIKDNPELVPIYFLYTFFDYRLDRFCENITEFGLDKDGFANITLSLWALLHGMGDLYSEYKNSKLNNREKKAYKKIYAAMQNHELSVTINGFIETDIPKLMSAINLDNPHLFFVDFHYELQSDLFSQTVILKYIYNQADTLILTEKVKKVCNKILSKVTGKTEFEKELSLHDILARNVLYDDVAKDNLLKFHARSNTILGALFYKTAVCEGIAKTFKFLLNALDIKCIVVKGKATDDLSSSVSADTLHAWNIVKIDGKPYHVDLTWNISSSDKNMLCHYYFNLSDVDISIDHAISSDLPKCRSNNENYYYKSGLIVENKSDLRGIVYKCIQNGINTVEFKLCANVFENETETMYFVQKSIDVATYYLKSFSLAYAANLRRNVYFFLWTFK